MSENTADAVQLISAPLEIIGITLAIIELKFPRKADTIVLFLKLSQVAVKHTWFFLLGAFIKKFQHPYILNSIKLRRLHIPRLSALVISLFYLVLFTFFLLFLSSFSYNASKYDLTFSDYSILDWMVFSIGASITFFSCYFIYKIFSFLFWFKKGKAIGTLGLLLAALGVSGEIYQVILILF